MQTITQGGDLALATGRAAGRTTAGLLVLALPGTDYQLHLAADPLPEESACPTVQGRITARARRVDVVGTGGRFIEPVAGRPRRIQGTVLATDPEGNTLTLRAAAGCPLVCTLMAGQLAGRFAVGQMVACDVERGAAFEPM